MQAAKHIAAPKAVKKVQRGVGVPSRDMEIARQLVREYRVKKRAAGGKSIGVKKAKTGRKTASRK